MKLSALLASRSTILRQAALAHAAAAWLTLNNASRRVALAGLHGDVRLRQTDPDEGEAPWASLTSDTIRASVLEEHFTEDDLVELAEAVAYATDSPSADVEFPIESLGDLYATPLLQTLEKAGVVIDVDESRIDSRRD